MEGRIIKFLAYEGRALVKCIDSTNIVEEARKIHDLSPTVTAALGRLLTMTSMMGADLKEIEDSITVQIKGDGLAGTLTAVTDSNGNVKGYVTNPLVELPLNEVGKLDVSKAVGKNGMMYIIKDIGLKDPYVGMTPIISGEIAEDFTNYFAKSEQTPTVVALGVLVDKNGVKKAGGYQIYLMPDAKEEDIENIEAAIKKADTISKMLNDEISLEQIAKIVTGDNDIKIIDDTIKPEYKCDCSREKIEKGLIAIGEKEIQDIINTDGKAETVCQFCNKKYHFNKEELEKLINKK